MNEVSERIRPNREIADHIPVVRGDTAGALVPQDAGQAMEFAKIMASGQCGVPKHLRGVPGACLRIVSDAMNFGMSPFHLADDSFVIGDRLSYGAKTIYAMVLKSGVLVAPLSVAFQGDGPNLVCTATGQRRGMAAPVTKTVRSSQITTKNSPLWKTDPEQQLGYYTQRAWCRLYAPDAIMGLTADTDDMLDLTPTPVLQDATDVVRGHLSAPAMIERTRQEDKSEPEAAADESEDPATRPDAGHDYTLTNWDGEVTEDLHAGQFTDAFMKAIKAAPDIGSLQSLQIDHTSALERLKRDGEQGPGWHAVLMEATKARFTALSAPAASDERQDATV